MICVRGQYLNCVLQLTLIFGCSVCVKAICLDYVVVKIFVHRWKPKRDEQTRDVQRCTRTCCICNLFIVISVKCMGLEMHHRIHKM